MILGFMLNVEDGRKIARLKFHILDEIVSLRFCRRIYTIEMISATNKTIFAGIIEIIDEIIINLTRTFGGLDHHETHWALLYHTVVLQCLPVYLSLIVADVDTVYFISLGIGDVAIESTPSKSKWRDEEIIEEINVEQNNYTASKPPGTFALFISKTAQ